VEPAEGAAGDHDVGPIHDRGPDRHVVHDDGARSRATAHLRSIGRDPEHLEALAAAGGTPATTSTIGGHVGIGVRIYLNRFLALRFDVKDYVYSVTVPNWIEGTGNQPRSDIQNQLFLELGLSFFLPTSPRATGGGT